MASHLVSFQSHQWPINGCVHLPDHEAEEKVGVIILAEVTKFGSHGLHRKVAEAFAASGYYVLRYDNRGTYDSPGICALDFDDRVDDACAAAEFFRTEYRLDKLLFWGICMGSAVAVHASARLSGPLKPAGMILCTLLADSSYASLPEFNYRPVTVSAYVRNGLTGSPWNRLRAVIADGIYRTNQLGSVARVARNYYSEGVGKLQTISGGMARLRNLRSKVSRGIDKLQTVSRSVARLHNMRSHVSRVGSLLEQYDGPCLLIHADTDPCWHSLRKDIKTGRRLRISRMKRLPRIAELAGTERYFRAVEDRSRVIGLSVSWALALRDGRNLATASNDISATYYETQIAV